MCMINKLLNRNDNENCKDCEQAKQVYLEFSSKLQNENEKYTTIVLSVGYVSYISLLASSFSNLYSVGKWWWFSCILLITISLGLFVGYEIWKLKCCYKYNGSIYSELKNIFSKDKSFSYTDLIYKIEKINEKHYIDIHKATCWIFTLSLLSAYVSVILFFISLSLNFARL